MSEFELAVRHALLDRGMSLSDLAEVMGISVSYVYEIIKGTRKAEDQKRRIKDLLGLKGSDDDVAETIR